MIEDKDIPKQGQVPYQMGYNRALTAEEIKTLYNDPFCIFKFSWWQRWKLRPRGRISRKIHQIMRLFLDLVEFLRTNKW